jgi:damage-control phosphatase, subfamily III
MIYRPIIDDGQPDIKSYNEELEARGNPQWFDVPWLYAECYLYRRLNTIFSTTKYWKSYDVFAKQKMSTFRSSRPAVIELAARYKDLIKQIEQTSTADNSKSTAAVEEEEEKEEKEEEEKVEVAEKLIFFEMCEICLWGNATDLSLLTSLTYEDIQKLQGSKARKESENNILTNDLSAAFKVLKQAQKESPKGERQVDIILDNAGFELFVDLILAGYLLSSKLATRVVLHPKSIPWFVSDVLPADFAALLNALANPQGFYTSLTDDDKHAGRTPAPLSEEEAKDISFLFDHWSRLHGEGLLAIRPNRFWTLPGSYWRLPKLEPRLFEDLKESQLVIFKGDLNYRKLTGDVRFYHFHPFFLQ